ncbi:hypothetical protein IF1G_00840 [Cordyceps javanica]|uniref:Uncharacterized protein n=1 Tax=Cordyceps javanica TaxID=43265 RepID=A0A545VGP3_9HYPO|nr:hypothetical protein IF1G_00840 [Cordyceps javanica]
MSSNHCEGVHSTSDSSDSTTQWYPVVDSIALVPIHTPCKLPANVGGTTSNSQTKRAPRKSFWPGPRLVDVTLSLSYHLLIFSTGMVGFTPVLDSFRRSANIGLSQKCLFRCGESLLTPLGFDLHPNGEGRVVPREETPGPVNNRAAISDGASQRLELCG